VASTDPASRTARTRPETTISSPIATTAAAAKSAVARIPRSWFVPSSGISQNAVTNVPAILPAVETANSRPAVLPTVASSLARRRTAIGVAVARITLGMPNSAIAAKSGFRRGPGSQRTIASSTASSMTGTSSVAPAPIARTTSSSCGAGMRSASAPPVQ
jgi:hypothetical protein